MTELDQLLEALSAGALTVTVDDEQVVLCGPGSRRVLCPQADSSYTLLRALQALGNSADRALDQLERVAGEREEAERAAAEAARAAAALARWTSWQPTALPSGATVVVTRPEQLADRAANDEDRLSARGAAGALQVGDRTVHSWLAALDVHAGDGTRVATVTVTDTGAAELHLRFADALTGYYEPSLPREQHTALQAANPWPQVRATLPASGDPGELAHALLAHADAVAGWVAQVEQTRREVRAAADAAAAAHEQAARDWRKLSRSTTRIPTAALTAWLRDRSHIEYRSDGSKSGGWEVVAVTLAGQSRPAQLELPRRYSRRSAGAAIGAKEVLYAVRLEHRSVYRRDGERSLHSFYASDVDSLTKALPGCVIKAPEDRKVLFVAFDAPEYVQTIDGALAEWVLTDGAID